MTLYSDKYGDTLSVEACNDSDVHLASMDQDYLFDRAQAETLAAAIVVASCAYDGKRNFKCNSGDGSELSPRRAPSGNVAIINAGQDGAAYTGEVILTPADALALAFELIRMATHE